MRKNPFKKYKNYLIINSPITSDKKWKIFNYIQYKYKLYNLFNKIIFKPKIKYNYFKMRGVSCFKIINIKKIIILFVKFV